MKKAFLLALQNSISTISSPESRLALPVAYENAQFRIYTMRHAATPVKRWLPPSPRLRRGGDGRHLVTATGNFNIVAAEHMSKMKDKAIVANIGHFDNEIDMAGLGKWKGIEKIAIENGRARTVVAYSGTRLRAFGDKPATKFAAAFVEVYRDGNR
ncbi:MAG TPA: hypothetical protein VKA59_25690 [Vicinamibacterales bacterium]|nr:hypothetical protein [Vicinamibacterales bacterium]